MFRISFRLELRDRKQWQAGARFVPCSRRRVRQPRPCTIGNIRIDVSASSLRSTPEGDTNIANLAAGLGEPFTCVGLGLRDARHAGLWWRFALWCVAVVALWLGLYSYFGRFFVELSAMLALVFVTGLLGLGVMNGVGALANGPATVTQMGNIAGGLGSAAKALLSIGQIALALLALAAFFYVMVFVVGAIGTVRVPLRWLLLERAKAVVARRYATWQAPAGLVHAPRAPPDGGACCCCSPC